jgi:hypothetical protein
MVIDSRSTCIHTRVTHTGVCVAESVLSVPDEAGSDVADLIQRQLAAKNRLDLLHRQVGLPTVWIFASWPSGNDERSRPNWRYHPTCPLWERGYGPPQ